MLQLCSNSDLYFYSKIRLFCGFFEVKGWYVYLAYSSWLTSWSDTFNIMHLCTLPTPEDKNTYINKRTFQGLAYHYNCSWKVLFTFACIIFKKYQVSFYFLRLTEIGAIVIFVLLCILCFLVIYWMTNS